MMAESRVVSLSTPLSGSFCLILHIWLFPGLTQEWQQVQASQGAQTERKTLCGHAIIWCEAPWPYSPRGPGEGGNGQLISVNCEWVWASEQPFPCSEAWLLWLLAGQEIQTLTLPGVHTQCRAPHPRSLTAHSSLLDSGPESEPGCEASGAGPGPDVSYRNTAAGCVRQSGAAPVLLSLFGSTVRWSSPWSAAPVTTWWSTPGPWCRRTWTLTLLCDK